MNEAGDGAWEVTGASECLQNCQYLVPSPSLLAGREPKSSGVLLLQKHKGLTHGEIEFLKAAQGF